MIDTRPGALARRCVLSTPSIVLTTSLVAILGAAPASAQKSDAEVQAEIDFARGLAADWSFVDLAEGVVRDVEEAGVSSRMSEQLGLVKCDVYAIGARNERDPERRNQLFDDALDAYQSFISDNPNSSARGPAEAAFVDTAAAYSRFLSMAIEDAVGEEAEKLRERQTEVLTDAVDQTSDLVSQMQSVPAGERSETESRQLYDLMLNRGDMLAQIGAAQKEQFFFDQALQSLEALVFEAGPGTTYSLRAYIASANVYSAMGDHGEAATYCEAVVAETIPIDPEVWAEVAGDELSEDEKGLRFLFLERATPGLMDALLAQGDLETALAYGLHFVNFQRNEGMSLSAYGHQGMLAVSRVLMTAGGFVAGDLAAGEARWFATEEEAKDAESSRRNRRAAIDLALRFAQATKEENSGNILRVRAQKLMSDIIKRPGVTPSPEILFEAAEGQYLDAQGNSDREAQAKLYAEALDGYRGVLRALDGQDQATRIEYGAKVMYGIGNCYRRMGRGLEAAMAYREGATTWLGDPSFDAKNAQGFYKMISDYEKAASADKSVLEDLISEAERIVAEEGESQKDKVLYDLGKKAERKQDFDKALQQYSQVAEGSDYFEPAMVAKGVLRVKQKDASGALEIFDNYLDSYVADAKNASTSSAYLAQRKGAKATAEFYRGFVLFNQAQAAGSASGYANVIEKLGGFYLDYPEQDSLAPFAMQMVMESQLKSNANGDAREMLAKMVELFPDARYTSNASLKYYVALETQYKSSEGEDKMTVLREMADHLKRANSASSSPSFGNLRKESQHWLELGEFGNAEALLRRMLDKFGDSAEHAESMRRYVRPDLGTALLAQKKVADAKDVLQPLIIGAEHRASRETVVNWARSVVGWLEGSGSDIEIVPGADATEEELSEASSRLSTIAQGGDKWISCTWYEDKFMSIYALYVWGQKNSSKLDSAKRQIGTVIAETEADFSIVDEFCSSDETPEAVRNALGGRTLQDRYRWLSSNL